MFSTSLAVFQFNRIFFTPVVKVSSQSLWFYGIYGALQKHKMFLIAFKKHCSYDEILVSSGVTLGPIWRVPIQSIDLHYWGFSITFSEKLAFVPGKMVKPWFVFHQIKKDTGRQQWWYGNVYWLVNEEGYKACISFWWYLNVHVMLLLRGERWLWENKNQVTFKFLCVFFNT